jgi:hypothetical protein
VTGTAVELATLQWGPSTFIDGEVLAATNANDARMLQWGRRSSSTERINVPAEPPDLLAASMGPSIFIDGELR